MSVVEKVFGAVAGMLGIGADNIKTEWECVKEEVLHLRRVREICKAGIDFENPGEKDLDAAQYMAKMVERVKENHSFEHTGDTVGAVHLFAMINGSQIVDEELDFEEVIDFADFAEKCIKLCDENGLSYCPDEAPKAEGDGPETELIAD